MNSSFVCHTGKSMVPDHGLWDACLEKLCNVKSAPQLKQGEEVSNVKQFIYTFGDGLRLTLLL